MSKAKLAQEANCLAVVLTAEILREHLLEHTIVRHAGE